MNVVPPPSFRINLLKPKYWPIWFGFGLLAVMVNILPYRALKSIGFCIGLMAKKLLKKRAKVAKRNLELCFPDYSKDKIDNLVVDNFKNTGMALIETGMAWFWPDWRVRLHSKIVGDNTLLKMEYDSRGV